MYVDLARFGSLAPAGKTRRTPVACPMRPGRRRCAGLLVVRRREVPPTVDFACPVCEAAGSITGWEDTAADLGVLRGSLEPGSVGVRIDASQHAVLRELARVESNLVQLVFACTVDEDGAVFLSPAIAGDPHPGAFVLCAALETPTMRRRKGVTEMIEALSTLAIAGISKSEMMAQAMEVAFADALEGAPQPAASRARKPGARRAPAKGGRRSRRDARTFQLKVTLRDVKPPVWRRILVPADILLPALHEVLQLAFGWTDSHLHAFRVGRRSFAPPFDCDPIGEDSRSVELQSLAAGKGSRLVYEYDFGDGWCHDILVEEVRAEACPSASCTGGRRSCPPEDCGGPWGYEELRAALADPTHERHEEASDWMPVDFDDEDFDVAIADAAVRHLKV